MKLLIILSVIACSYGDKLDRTYLPPESAGTAGGSPGSIAAPGTETELGVPKGATFGQPTGSSFGQPSGPSFGQPSGPSFGKPSGLSFGQPSRPSFGQPSGPSFGQSSGPSFGQPSGPSFGQPSGPSFGQPSGASSGQPSGPSFSQSSSPSFGQTSGPSFGQPSGSTFGQPSGPSISEPSDSTFGKGPNQAGPQSGSAQPGQPGAGSTGSQYQAGNSADASIPGFGQAGTGFNKAPAFGGESQSPTSYTGPSQPERARASIDRNAETLRYENNIDGDTFAYSFETSNGIAADEAGVATNGVRAQGGFSYTGDDGQFYSVRYTADENGYVPQGDHLPTPHPIPEEILKSLEENARAAAAGTQEGAYNPNEDSGLDNSASYPGTASNGYQPGQGSVSQYSGPDASLAIARPQDGQEFGSKYNRPATSFGPQGSLGAGTPQYEAPTSSLTNYARPGSSGNQLPGSQYGTPGISPTTSKPGFQDGQSPASQYNGSFRPSLSSQGTTFPTYDTPTGTPGIMGQQGSTRPGSQRLSSKDRPTLSTQYGAPVSSSSSATSPSFPAQGSTSFFTNNVPSFGLSSDAQSGQPGQSSVSQIGDSAGSSNGFKRPFGSQGFPSQNGAQSQLNPISQLDTATSSGLNGQNSGYQYKSPSAFSVSTRPETQKFSSPVSSSSAPQFDKSAVTPSGSDGVTRPQSFTSGTIPGPESSRPYSSQSATSQNNAPVSSSLRPGSQVGSSSAPQFETPAGSPFGSTALSGTPLGPESSQIYGNQSPTSQYNTPGTSPFSSTRPGSQTKPSYVTSSPASQYDTSAGSPFGPTALSGPQGSSSGSPSGLGASQPVSSQSSNFQYKAPGTGTFGSVNTESQGFPSGQSGLNQRPQFGYSTSSGLSAPTISGTKGQNSQKQDESGYKYSPPQTQFDQQEPKLSGSRFRPSDSTGSLKPVNKETIFGNGLSQGNNYNQLGSAQKFPGSSNKDYATGPSLSGSTIGTERQTSPFSGAGQYTSTGLGSRPIGSTFPRRDSAIGTTPQYQSSQTPASQSSMPDSTPYQYDRPKSQESGQAGILPGFGLSGQKKSGQAGYQPIFGSSGQERPGQVGYQPSFGSSGQKGAGQVGYQPTFGSAAQERPGQAGYQPTFGSSGQKRPGQVGYQSTFGSAGEKRPGQVGSQPTFGSPAQQRPGQVDYQPTFGSSAQERPGQGGYQTSFGSSGQERPGQAGSQLSPGLSREERPGQYRPGSLEQKEPGQTGYDFSKQKRPGQTGSQPSFSPSSQDAPSQTGTQPGFGFLGQDRPGQTGTQPSFGSSGQQGPGQKQFPSGSGTLGSKGPGQVGSQSPFTSSGQDRPGQLGKGKPTENFNGPRQPPSFSAEEGYKY